MFNFIKRLIVLIYTKSVTIHKVLLKDHYHWQLSILVLGYTLNFLKT